jgi:Ca2+-binding RTX toxin-like protein
MKRILPQNAVINGDGTDETLAGTADSDTIDGAGGNDTLSGLAGDDILIGGTGDDIMSGGLDNDTYYVDSAGDVVNEAAGEGNDRIATAVSYALAAGSEVERLEALHYSGTAALNLTGNELANILIGNAGANLLDGGGGADTMTGGPGDDVYYVDDAGDVVLEEAGAAAGIDRVATLVSYVLAANALIETLEALNQASTNAMDLTGSDTANVIRGNEGVNVVRGGGGNDVLYGYGGDDVLIGETGNDQMLGGGGNDTYYVEDTGDTVGDIAGEGTDRIATSVSFTVSQFMEIETLEAVNITDTTAINLTGSASTLTIIGNEGANILTGDHKLIGLGGDDTLGGSTASNYMYGGTGNDTYTVLDPANNVIELVGEGTDSVRSGTISYALPAGAEIEFLLTTNSANTQNFRLTGNEFSQTITGNAGNNVIIGGGGDDVMIGLGGSDHYYVDSAGDIVQETDTIPPNADWISTTVSYALAAGCAVERLEPVTISAADSIDLTGNEFTNAVTGNNGNNVINGGGGNDYLAGVGGADTFAFTTPIGPNNSDTIADFSSANDRIALDDAIFTGLAPGALPAGAFVIGAAAQDADDRIIYNSANGRLYFDADGNGAGAAVQFATLHLNPAIVATDFLVI